MVWTHLMDDSWSGSKLKRGSDREGDCLACCGGLNACGGLKL